MKKRWAVKIAGMIAIAIVAVFGIGYGVMLLWNALVPELFKGPVITYWQAIGILILSHILFRSGGHGRHGWHRDRWSYKMEKRYGEMTPEEREKFRETWLHRCGCPPPPENAQ
jgi:hypothetical protein